MGYILPNQSDKDIAFLILQFGGPGLLDICHRALNLPSTSTAYRMLKGSEKINSSLDVTPEMVVDNISFSKVLPAYVYMLKIDETYVDQKIRWCPLDNTLYGFCYEHGCNFNRTFDTYSNIKALTDAVHAGTIPIAKECMVIAVGCNNTDTDSQVILSWPACSKSEVDRYTSKYD